MNDFILNNKESIREDIKRIVSDQIDSAKCHLEKNLDKEFDESIHEVRKCIKRIRAVLRLIRDDIDDALYKRENYYFRDINRCLSEIRSITAIIETLKKYTSSNSLGHNYRSLTNNFLELKEKIIYKLCVDENRLPVVVELLSKGKSRIEEIPVRKVDVEILINGLIRVFKKCQKCMISAKLDSSIENLHEWRKQVKYLFYEFQVLRPVFTEELTIYESNLDKLADYLGEDHDLAELGDCLRCNPYIFIEANRLESLNSIINKSRQEKQNVLFTFAGEIFNEKLNNIMDHLLSD